MSDSPAHEWDGNALRPQPRSGARVHMNVGGEKGARARDKRRGDEASSAESHADSPIDERGPATMVTMFEAGSPWQPGVWPGGRASHPCSSVATRRSHLESGMAAGFCLAWYSRDSCNSLCQCAAGDRFADRQRVAAVGLAQRRYTAPCGWRVDHVRARFNETAPARTSLAA